MTEPPRIFDRNAVKRNQHRAASLGEMEPPLIRDLRAGLLDRIRDVTRTFQHALVQGMRPEITAKILVDHHGIQQAFGMESTAAGARSDSADFTAVAGDEEWIPFGFGAFDIVVSQLCLHWTNDLPGSLIQLRRTLKPDGLFLASVFGGETLNELRTSWLAAESTLRGGVTPRVSPLLDVRDAGNLLLRAGFALPVTDTDRYTLEFANLRELALFLRLIGETNAVTNRARGLTTPRLWKAVEDHYSEHFTNANGKLRATFDLITLTGWAPDATQQKPLAPGSAASRLADALGSDEKPI
jgi:NADH dehydrogenase [ubiquinone] 1 alpha subcomplex assembly factor 5